MKATLQRCMVPTQTSHHFRNSPHCVLLDSGGASFFIFPLLLLMAHVGAWQPVQPRRKLALRRHHAAPPTEHARALQRVLRVAPLRRRGLAQPPGAAEIAPGRHPVKVPRWRLQLAIARGTPAHNGAVVPQPARVPVPGRQAREPPAWRVALAIHVAAPACDGSVVCAHTARVHTPHRTTTRPIQ